MYESTRPGWNVESTHPVTEDADAPLCATCSEAIDYAIRIAVYGESEAHSHTVTDANGDVHTVTVRKIGE